MRIPTTVTVAVLLIFVGLLALVVIVGLIRNQVDTNGLAIVLTPVITGIVMGGAIRLRGKDDGKDSS